MTQQESFREFLLSLFLSLKDLSFENKIGRHNLDMTQMMHYFAI